MAEAVRTFPLRRAIPSSNELERKQLVEELSRTRILTNQAYSSFNNACDQDLIESFVYEINALQARCNYLLRRIKELEVQP
jgi:hypothetical protein